MEINSWQQNLKFSLRKTSLLLLGLALSACATKPPDVPLCKELTPGRGFCVHIISGRSYEVNDDNLLQGKTWWDLRPTNIAMPASSWAEMKKYIIQSCKKYGHCDKEVSSWDRTVEIIDTKLK